LLKLEVLILQLSTTGVNLGAIVLVCKYFLNIYNIILIIDDIIILLS